MKGEGVEKGGLTRMSGLGRPTVILTMLVAVFVNARDSALFHSSTALFCQPQSTSRRKAGGKKQGRENVQA